MATVEGHMHSVSDRDQEVELLRSKLIDLEDRSRRDNICLTGFPEQAEDTDTPSFLRTVLQLTEIVFDPQLEIQRAHRLGPRRGSPKARPIITSLLRHEQVCQILTIARIRGLLKMNGLENRITADFSRETNE
ncbi:hypothetical protein NDU88_004090 [Pleurodeles waltl]|uniref:Uncharacterized protein n=1 Tax=Pleurodeles waltl TaxID=8319 RepID=A0AAV7NL71_PLEWA|nr:hypothetical protein NDU88_004090 [Pleurodeles waltl]